MAVKFNDFHSSSSRSSTLEAVASDGPYMNQVYSMPMTTTREVGAGPNSHSDPSSASQNFNELVWEKVQEQLSIEMQNMRIKMREDLREKMRVAIQ